MEIEDSVSESSMGANAQLKLDIREIDNDLKALGGIASFAPTPKEGSLENDRKLSLILENLSQRESRKNTQKKRGNRNFNV